MKVPLVEGVDLLPFSRYQRDADTGFQHPRGLAVITECFDQESKRRRRLAPARIIEVIAGKRRTPVSEHTHETLFSDMSAQVAP